jgi:putative FmdB family regulatory protein
MPMYEYYCPTCQAKFEKLRSMSASDGAVRCAQGHEGARRLISVFAMGNRSAEPAAIPAGGAGCCGGGGCACS